MVKALPNGFRSVVGVACDDAGHDADPILLQQLCRRKDVGVVETYLSFEPA
jgi:hypothetical protein